MRKITFLILISIIITSCTQEKVHNIIVIGGGLMGSSTAWQLTNQGKEVLLIEQQDSVYTYGSSLGEARIVRSLGPKGDVFSYLHNRSVRETQKLISVLRSSGEKASMEDIYTTSPVSYVRHIKQTDRINKILEGQQDRYEFASTPEQAKKLFNANMPDTTIFLREYKQHSGTLNPKALIAHTHTAIRKSGNQIWYNTKVLDLSKEDQLYVIKIKNEQTGDTKTIKSKKIVSAAGPYTGKLLKKVAPEFDQLIHPERVFLAFFKINAEVYASLPEQDKKQLMKSYPVINSSKGTRKGSFFSMIEKVDTDGIPIIKIGGHFQRNDIKDLNKVWQQELTKEEITWSKESTLGYLQLLNLPVSGEQLEFINGYSCVYSLTETEVPFVSLAGNSNPNLVVLGGMSGVGAKGALTYGYIGANLITGKIESDEMYIKTVRTLSNERK